MTAYPYLDSLPQLEFKMTPMFRDCLSRQIEEALGKITLRISFKKQK
jgi:hypothetical protein